LQTRLTAIGTHMSNEIMQCYLPQAEVIFPPLLQPIKAGIQTNHFQ